MIIQGRVTFESDNDDLTTESDSEDEYMDEYSYDSPSSDSGGPVDKELNPFRVAKRQLSLGLFSYEGAFLGLEALTEKCGLISSCLNPIWHFFLRDQ